MIVLDANILIRAVLGRRVRLLIETYSAQRVRFFTPDVAFDDARKHLPHILKKRGKPQAGLAQSLEYLQTFIQPVARDLYAVFEPEARLRLRGRDEEDWPVIAAALALACGVWTEDADFFGTGIPAWTTTRVEIFLKSQARSRDPQGE